HEPAGGDELTSLRCLGTLSAASSPSNHANKARCDGRQSIISLPCLRISQSLVAERCGCSADFSNQVFVRDVFNDLAGIICAHRIAMNIATYLVGGLVLAFVLGIWSYAITIWLFVH